MGPIRRQRGDWVVIPPSAPSPPPPASPPSPPWPPAPTSVTARKDSVVETPPAMHIKQSPSLRDMDPPYADILFPPSPKCNIPCGPSQVEVDHSIDGNGYRSSNDEESDQSSDDEGSGHYSGEDDHREQACDNAGEGGLSDGSDNRRTLARKVNADRSSLCDDDERSVRSYNDDEQSVQSSVESEGSYVSTDTQFSGGEQFDLSVLNLASFRDFKARGAITLHSRGKQASTVFQYRAHSGAYYAVEIDRTRWSIKFEEAIDSLRRVPDEEIYPLMDWNLPVVSAIGQKNVHIRYPAVVSWACETSGTTKVARRFLAEARALDQLRQQPHQNVIQYLGCLVERGRLIGLVCPKYERDIYDWVNHQPRHQLEAVFAELTEGVKHLHALGLAHNSISPQSIMMKQDGEEHHPILTNMHRALPFGRKLHNLETDTKGWDDDFERVSSAENDELALENIWKFLIGERVYSW